MALIGNRGRKPMSGAMLAPEAVLAGDFPMPGIIGGYGGGTFNIDGTQATPVQRGFDGTSGPDQALPMNAAPNGITPSIIGGSAGNSSPSLFQMPNIDGSAMTFEGVKPSNPKQGAGFFSKNGGWRNVVGGLGDAMQTFGGGKATYAPMMAERRMAQQRQEERALQRETSWQDYVRRKKYDRDNAPPQYFTVGRDRVKFDPTTDQSQVVYDGLEDFDEYAVSMGYEPGTDEYETAVTDYVLRGNGPTALGIDKELDDYRTANDKGYDDYRTRNRLKVRGTPTYGQSNPTPSKSTPRKAPGVTAKNAKGEVISLNSRGQWVDKNGVPVQ